MLKDVHRAGKQTGSHKSFIPFKSSRSSGHKTLTQRHDVEYGSYFIFTTNKQRID